MAVSEGVVYALGEVHPWMTATQFVSYWSLGGKQLGSRYREVMG